MSAIHMGLTIQQYEEMTPYELTLYAEAFIEKQKNDQTEKLTMIWLGEYYHRIKKLPKLKELLKQMNLQEGQKEMSDDEMLKQIEQINKMMGGKVRKVGE